MRNIGYFELLFLLTFIPVLLIVLLAVRHGGPRVKPAHPRSAPDEDRHA